MSDRPDRPWPYWYEVRLETRGLLRSRPKWWWRDLFLIPIQTVVSQRAERKLYRAIPFDVLREAFREAFDPMEKDL
jgi:hypothetical protein